ncbi:hypothetical protein E3O25_05765 [Cryobacterium sp. TMT1-3]|uniref:hypothetical protein n=1 Tax=Cryobacterium sp. TMT1-3 TaxID=1259237 RepID=UPI00106C282C|nr:hypothetical protein [Cryobacterium sp. TMT1-3]TFC28709.1 hypothetical protein E3O25_05765 [Cryobacterium sp. TMT1-3]
MTWEVLFHESDRSVIETGELRAAGATWRSLKAAVDNGFLVRCRRGHYALPSTNRHILEAVRVGGRLGCISAAADMGVFALDSSSTHVHLDPNASRLRAPQDRFQRLTVANRNGIELHWDQLLASEDGTEYSIGLTDSLIQIFRCQQPRFALASLDNALHLRLLPSEAVVLIFAALPEDLQYLRAWVDARSESGQETVLRFIVHLAGFQFEIQVSISGVGRVDMVIEGCLVVEADSRQFHDGWDAHLRDRTRDCDLAGMTYMSYRAIHRDIFYHPERVVAAITGLLAVRNHFRTYVL